MSHLSCAGHQHARKEDEGGGIDRHYKQQRGLTKKGWHDCTNRQNCPNRYAIALETEPLPRGYYPCSAAQVTRKTPRPRTSQLPPQPETIVPADRPATPAFTPVEVPETPQLPGGLQTEETGVEELLGLSTDNQAEASTSRTEEKRPAIEYTSEEEEPQYPSILDQPEYQTTEEGLRKLYKRAERRVG